MAFRLNGISHWVMWEMASAVRAHRHRAGRHGHTVARPCGGGQARCQALQVPHGELRFDDVVFAYGGSRKVLDGFSLTIRPGEKIGLVGRSGAGKSTVVNLLLRLYDLESGRILIDGQDIAGVTQESLRRQVGMVTQDTSLLHRSVRDNIVYGRPDASDAEMLRASRARRGARLHRQA
jgi:ATP-binding cassette subfamily B multidrug efflux pump